MKPNSRTTAPSKEAATTRHELVRRANSQQVFDAIVARSPVSRVDIAANTRLSKPTVLGIVNVLEAQGLVRSSTPSTGAVGRAPALYEPDPTAGYVLGVDLGGSKVCVAVADLDGTMLGVKEEPTTRGGADALLDQLNRLLRATVRDSPASWKKVLAVTIGSPGVADANGKVSLASNVVGLDTLALGPELRRRLRKRVAVENDVNLAALGELAAGVAKDCHTFVVLSVGTGIGLGIVLDRKLVRGAHGAAGEISYLPIGANPRDPKSQVRGTLEIAASGSAVRRLLADELASGAHRDGASIGLDSDSTAREIYDAAATGNPIAKIVVGRHADVLAEAILAVSAMIDPEVVVLAGGIGSNDVLLEPLREAVAIVSPFPIRVESTLLGARAGVIGAIAHAQGDAWDTLHSMLAIHRNSTMPDPVDSVPRSGVLAR
ncbi:ROK family transcriptional regulator [Ilumatobacter sp.]|uniref:ROK family transcriptional regulator n=1 Tax=Ilumatobacter sp. TaxID=1967498 RepID=UPI00375100B2